jgi:hypothetical protein
MLSCNSKPHRASNSDSTSNIAVAIGYSGRLNLAKLTLKENIPALMTAQKVKLEPITDTDKTLWGHDRMKSNDPKALQFGGADLAGASGKNKNYVLLHYDEKTKKLIFYEVEMYSREQAKALSGELNKLGKPTFEKKWPDGSMDIDENGHAVQPKPDEKQIFQVWDDKLTGISYFYGAKENSHSFAAKLTVLKKADQAGRDWMSFSRLDWYQKR